MGNCDSVVIGHAFPDTAWESATFCGPNGGNCVEVNLGGWRVVGVRDSKSAAGPVLAFGEAGWAAFLAATRSGRFAG
jgi:hypothetical protein